MSPEGFKLNNDPVEETLNRLVLAGEVEVIDSDILGLPDGVIEFRTGDQYRVEQDAVTGRYQRVWPSKESYVVHTADQIRKERGN